jgi:hypothetical protein
LYRGLEISPPDVLVSNLRCWRCSYMRAS